MMRDDDFIYYRRRAAEENIAADRASSLAAARAHKQIAEHYAELGGARELRAAQPQKANDA
jgi:hypothetical protein